MSVMLCYENTSEFVFVSYAVPTTTLTWNYVHIDKFHQSFYFLFCLLTSGLVRQLLRCFWQLEATGKTIL